ncbi:hypothetical protein [Massilia sp. Mn16-1_5]|uniref:hypothetical protein n=1 Tax=Massilia sp. Mn16-1_5 TaxID=2079199 RepID=UPI00109EAB6C|nr:hypothetical protein [Massilia sp. Mn16-1_5]THC46749.1 hypothetical protein C2862_01270 [Massilia sp. Mn16-1_5]
MTLSTLYRSTWAVLAVALAFGLSAGHAMAQTAPAATATLDVTSIDATGQWRYSGVVTVPAPAGAQVLVNGRIQNQTSREGFQDALKANVGAPVARTGETLVLPYSVEGPPLTLGELRSALTIQVQDSLTNPTLRTLFAESATVSPSATCGCPPKGCVRTQGYWGNKPNVVWRAPYSRTALFFSSGLTWQQILDTPPRGSGYIILAHQYIAAVLNRAAGASAPAGVQSVIDAATTWFRSGTVPSTCGPGECAQQKTWAGMLDTYNNGAYPGAPKHCD